MNPAALLLSLLALPAFGQGSSKTKQIDQVCTQKKSEYGARFIRCEGFDSELKPLSASYQPTAVAPMGASRESVNKHLQGTNYKNHFPQIKGTKEYLDDYYDYGTAEKSRVEQGYPLAWRMLDIVKKRVGESSPLYAWFRDTWAPQFQPRRADISAGSCPVWSRWAVDREVHSSLKAITKGITCDGIPLDLGEIKEIYQTLYGAATPTTSSGNADWYVQKKASTFFSDRKDHTEVAQVMDSNIALARLGVLGAGDLDPGTLLQEYKQAIQAGKGASFDRDHGSEIWNQPIAAMVETTYKSQGSASRFLSAADYQAGTGGEDSYRELVDTETALVLRAARGDSDGTLGTQAEALARSKEQLLQKGLIRPRQAASAIDSVMKDLTLIYGEENKFASLKPDHVKTRSFQYASVTDRNDPSKRLKSVWVPPVVKLSALCKSSSSPSFIGFSGIDAQAECDKLKSDPSADYEVFGGAVPPRYVNFFDDEPMFEIGSGLKSEAYKMFQDMLVGENKCPVFDNAVIFSERFEEMAGDNVLDEKERAELEGLFDRSEFLTDDWLAKNVCNTAGVSGLSQLLTSLRAKQPDLCKSAR